MTAQISLAPSSRPGACRRSAPLHCTRENLAKLGGLVARENDDACSARSPHERQRDAGSTCVGSAVPDVASLIRATRHALALDPSPRGASAASLEGRRPGSNPSSTDPGLTRRSDSIGAQVGYSRLTMARACARARQDGERPSAPLARRRGIAAVSVARSGRNGATSTTVVRAVRM